MLYLNHFFEKECNVVLTLSCLTERCIKCFVELAFSFLAFPAVYKMKNYMKQFNKL